MNQIEPFFALLLNSLADAPLWAVIFLGIASLSYDDLLRSGFARRFVGLFKSTLTFAAGLLASQVLALNGTTQFQWWILVAAVLVLNGLHHARKYPSVKDRHGSTVLDARRAIACTVALALVGLSLIPMRLASFTTQAEAARPFAVKLPPRTEVSPTSYNEQVVAFQAGDACARSNHSYLDVVRQDGTAVTIYVDEYSAELMLGLRKVLAALESRDEGRRGPVVVELTSAMTSVNLHSELWEAKSIRLVE